MKIMNSNGPITEPWGAPDSTFLIWNMSDLLLQIVSYWLGNIQSILIYYLQVYLYLLILLKVLYARLYQTIF